MKKIIFFICLLFFTSSCDKGELSLNKNQNTYTVIPHHGLVNLEIDDFYANLKQKYKNFDNIVIISPNHFGSTNYNFSSNDKLCYLDDCVNFKAFPNSGEKVPYTFQKIDNKIITKEHGLGNHFYFINKHFKAKNLYGILLKIKTKKDDYFSLIKKEIQDFNFKGKTLFIASVDFSHHVNEKVAVFHDLNTINFLDNKSTNGKIEVDCPNCLFLIKDLANDNGLKEFNLFNRTSSHKHLNQNTNFENTSHIYGEFTNIDSDNEELLKDNYKISKFDNSINLGISKGSVSGMFFGDTHFTRFFSDPKNNLQQEGYLRCFYSYADLQRKPKYWHNRMFYGFDFVGVNLETPIGNKNECTKTEKLVNFQTLPKYLPGFKDVGINLYNLSNNHSLDCGEIGLKSTKTHLENYNLNYFSEKPFKKEINGIKIAFIGFDDSVNQIDIEQKSQKIKELTEAGYNVVVNIHWGIEYQTKANNRQKKIAKYFVDSGVKMIVGHHPHVVQEFEEIDGIPVFYSLGNFIFDQPFKQTLKGYGVVYSLNNNEIKYNVIEFERDSKKQNIVCDSFK